MSQRKGLNYNHTVFACYIGYVIQAIVNNLAPLLFIIFRNEFSLPIEKITTLVTFNFLFQLAVDFVSAKIVDKIGYRICVVFAQIFSAAGLIGLGVLPDAFPSPYVGLVVSIALYALGGGLIEVLVSPIVEACPINNKKAAMSLLHSFYCWGHLFVVLASTAFFLIAGTKNWRVLCMLWSVIPIVNAFFFAKVPIKTLTPDGGKMSLKQLFSSKTFIIFLLVMVCAGASEQGMSQWASAFAEAGLGVSKTMGDLLGPSLFAALMGISRVVYSKISDKVNLSRYMVICSACCIAAYIVASLSESPFISLLGCAFCGATVGVMWPGSFSLVSETFPLGGTAMFAIMALAGDLGCSLGPTVVGAFTGFLGDDLKKGVIFGAIFPLMLIILTLMRERNFKRKTAALDNTDDFV